MFEASTRGNRYRVEVTCQDGKYDLTSYTRGQSTGRAANYSKGEMLKRATRELYYAKKFDGINYKIGLDLLGVATILRGAPGWV